MTTLGSYVKKYEAQVKKSVKEIINSEYTCPEDVESENWIKTVFNSEYLKCFEIEHEIRQSFSFLAESTYLSEVFERSNAKLVKARELALI